jgi:membrane associated rhomboid family serine protease
MEAKYQSVKTGEPMRSRKKFLHPGPYLKWAFADHPAVVTVMGINSVLFFVTIAAELVNLDLLAWGGGLGTLQVAGEWWRLLTSFFLHASLAHLWFNMNCLDDFGGAVERNFGQRIFLIGYFACGIGSSLISMYFHPTVLSVGASGAIFGTVGMIMPSVLARRIIFDKDDQRIALGGLVAFTMLNLGLGALVPGIDNAAHAGGLAVGVLIGIILIPKRPQDDADLSPSRVHR